MNGHSLIDLPLLTDEEWRALHEALTVHALYKSLRLSWRGLPRGTTDTLPGGQSPADIASEAMVLVIEGTRECEATTYSELLKHLKGVIDSLVSHAVESLENRSIRDRPQATTAGDRSPAKDSDPSHVVSEKEAAARLRKEIEKRVQADPLVAGVFRCLEEEITSPSEMAILLDVPITEVHNAQKRLRTAVLAILRQQGKATHGRVRTSR